jgi:hypothetical protein
MNTSAEKTFVVAEIREIPTENGVVLDINLYNSLKTWVESRLATGIVKTTRKTTNQKPWATSKHR